MCFQHAKLKNRARLPSMFTVVRERPTLLLYTPVINTASSQTFLPPPNERRRRRRRNGANMGELLHVLTMYSSIYSSYLKTELSAFLTPPRPCMSMRISLCIFIFPPVLLLPPLVSISLGTPHDFRIVEVGVALLSRLRTTMLVLLHSLHRLFCCLFQVAL